MPDASTFQPEWASAPGRTITAILRERSMSVSVLASRLGETEARVGDMIAARSSITPGIAAKLETALGGSASFWLRRESQYRDALNRLSTAQPRSTEETWLSELPVRDMVQLGWVKKARTRAKQVEQCLSFFDVPDLAAWRARYGGVFRHVAFRTSPSFSQQPASVAAWLRQGELEAAKVSCDPWNREAFRESLKEARALTRQRHPKDFVHQLVRICARSGVAVAIVRAPAGCRASGATRFLSANQALLLLSFRYLSDDQFWFTLFHEAGHLVLHSMDAVFIDGKGLPNRTEEQQANDFATDVLVPREFRTTLNSLPLEKKAVRHFALSVGVSPGIIVGQLQHAGRVPHTKLNQLKVRFTWTE